MMSNKNSFYWSVEEKSIMRAYYGHIPKEELQSKLFSVSGRLRSFETISNRAYLLGLTKKAKKNKWSQLELDYLKSNFNNLTYKEIAINLNRTRSSVIKAYIRYFPDLLSNANKFTLEEIDYIKENSDKGVSFIAKNLKRNKSSIQYKMKQLGVFNPRSYSKYTQKEIQYLKDNSKLTAFQLAKNLNRTHASVRDKLKQLGLYNPRNKNIK